MEPAGAWLAAERARDSRAALDTRITCSAQRVVTREEAGRRAGAATGERQGEGVIEIVEADRAEVEGGGRRARHMPPVGARVPPAEGLRTQVSEARSPLSPDVTRPRAGEPHMTPRAFLKEEATEAAVLTPAFSEAGDSGRHRSRRAQDDVAAVTQV